MPQTENQFLRDVPGYPSAGHCYASIAGNTLLLCCLTMWCVYMHVQFTNSAMAKAADIADPIEGIAAEVFFVSNLCFVLLVTSCKHCEEIREIKYLLGC